MVLAETRDSWGLKETTDVEANVAQSVTTISPVTAHARTPSIPSVNLMHPAQRAPFETIFIS